MGEQRQPELVAALDDAAAERAVVEGRERDLHRRHRRELDCLVELPTVDIGHADPADEAVVDEPRERTHRRAPRRPRIRSVQEVEVDRRAAERVQARLAVRTNRFRTAVRHPRAAGSGHAALRYHPRAQLRSAAAQRVGEQLLVARVRACGVEDGDACVGGRGDRVPC